MRWVDALPGSMCPRSAQCNLAGSRLRLRLHCGTRHTAAGGGQQHHVPGSRLNAQMRLQFGGSNMPVQSGGPSHAPPSWKQASLMGPTALTSPGPNICRQCAVARLMSPRGSLMKS